ncbi:hypothetical protein [Nannocystis pusilla]|uniref:hypothetical protein n=1 Tax=Nannocystis pusilla TaxID=889268 RepID=UPI003B826A90
MCRVLQEPPDGVSISDDSWCEWGFAEGGTACKDIDGIRIVESTLPIDCRSSMNEEDPRCLIPDDDNAAELGEARPSRAASAGSTAATSTSPVTGSSSAP